MSAGTRFGQIVSFHIGGGWGQEDPTPDEGGPAFVIRGTDIPGARHGDVRNVPLRYHKANALAIRELQAGDIVFESSGGSKGQPVGRALLITNALLKKFDEPVMCASFCKTIRPDAEQVDPAYLYYCLLNDYSDGTLSEYQVQSTGITNFQWKTFLEHRELVLPPLPTQRRVGIALRTIDDLIENNRRRIEVLEEMAQAIYREWFVHFRYPGHEDATFVDSPLGPIPEGWEVSTCGDELVVLGGGTPSKKEPTYWNDGDVPWYTPSDLTKSRSKFAAPPDLRINELGLSKSSARRFPAGSVMMTSRATLGVLAIAQSDATTNQGFIVIPPDERWPPSFIYEWLDHNSDRLEAVATGATFKEITKGSFRKIPFLVPARDALSAFQSAVQPIDDQIKTLLDETSLLADLRDLLLPKLVTGGVDVSQLDFDAWAGSAS